MAAVLQRQSSSRRLFSSGLPTTGGFANNHVMVNMMRNDVCLEPLKRSLELDEMARCHAKNMAMTGMVVHSVDSLKELGALLNSKRVGENVQRGPSIHKMHQAAAQDRDSTILKNILNENFREFGMATCKGRDGKLYMCQLFR